MTEQVPYLREAGVTLVPALTDEQLGRIQEQLGSLESPYVLVSRLSEHSVLIQGIPVKAGSHLEADAMVWETIYTLVRSALDGPWDSNTTITAIDVRDCDGALAS